MGGLLVRDWHPEQSPTRHSRARQLSELVGRCRAHSGGGVSARRSRRAERRRTILRDGTPIPCLFAPSPSGSTLEATEAWRNGTMKLRDRDARRIETLLDARPNSCLGGLLLYALCAVSANRCLEIGSHSEGTTISSGARRCGAGTLVRERTARAA